jgi:hypothetical protein
MDERQTQIKEGAGLEESRVNQEFLDFLNKWSFPVLLIIAIVSGGYFLYNQWQARKIAQRDQAFAELGNLESSAAPSVFSLTTMAEEYDGIGRVSELALLQAAGIHLNAVRTGLDPADPDPTNPDSILSDEDIAFHLEQAGSLYRQVADRVEGNDELALFAINAAFGRAAVAESSGDFETARAQYAQAETLASGAGYAPLATIASEMASDAGSAEGATLYETAQFPRLPFEPEPLEATTEVIEGDPAVEEGADAAPTDDGDGPPAPPSDDPSDDQSDG